MLQVRIKWDLTKFQKNFSIIKIFPISEVRTDSNSYFQALPDIIQNKTKK